MLCVSKIHSAAESRVEQTHNIYREPVCYHSYLSTLNIRYARISADTISAMFSAVPIRAVPFSVM